MSIIGFGADVGRLKVRVATVESVRNLKLASDFLRHDVHVERGRSLGVAGGI
jgi:hypothetical protein